MFFYGEIFIHDLNIQIIGFSATSYVCLQSSSAKMPQDPIY